MSRFSLANFETIFAKDIDKNISDTYKLNFPEVPFINGGITELNYEEISNKFDIKPGEIVFVMGRPPCQ